MGSHRKRRQRREMMADFIDDVVSHIMESFCERQDAYRSVASGLGYVENEYRPPPAPRPQPASRSQPRARGKGGVYTSYRVPAIPAQQVNQRVHVRVNLGSSRAYSSRSDYYQDYQPSWQAPRARPRPAQPRAKPAAPPAPPPPPPISEDEKLANDLESAYKLLHLDPEVTTVKDVKKVRRAMAMKLHSDRGGNEELMKEVNAAVDVILEHLKAS